MELAIFVFEIPTGVVADTVSRRLSIIVSFVVSRLAAVLFGLLTSAPLIIAAYALWGIGYTFQSGAYEAWIADEVGEERLTRVLLRGAQVSNVGALAGIAVGTAVGILDLRAGIVAGGVGVILLAGFLALTMPETGFHPHRNEDGQTGPRALVATARRGGRLVRGHRLLLLMLAIAFVWGMWTESFDRLWQAQFLTSVGFPSVGGLSDVVWIGLLTGSAMVIGIAVTQVAVRRLEDASRDRLARVLLGVNGVILAAALLFAIAGVPWLAIVAYAAVSCRSLIVPLQSALGEPHDRGFLGAGHRALHREPVRRRRPGGRWPGDRGSRIVCGPAPGARAGCRRARAGARALRSCGAPHGVEPDLAALEEPGAALDAASPPLVGRTC